MNNKSWLLKTFIKTVGLMLTLGVSMTSCANPIDTITWQEEVKLLDGRVIVVTQKKRCEGAYNGSSYAACIARESWLTIHFPEFSPQPIVWHENLSPIVLNIYQEQLYLVADFPTEREFELYKQPQHPYIAFIWKDSNWQRIPFEAIPEAIYDVNMLIEKIPPPRITYLSIAKKESKEVNGHSSYRKWQKRLNPAHKW